MLRSADATWLSIQSQSRSCSGLQREPVEIEGVHAHAQGEHPSWVTVTWKDSGVGKDIDAKLHGRNISTIACEMPGGVSKRLPWFSRANRTRGGQKLVLLYERGLRQRWAKSRLHLESTPPPGWLKHGTPGPYHLPHMPQHFKLKIAQNTLVPYRRHGRQHR